MADVTHEVLAQVQVTHEETWWVSGPIDASDQELLDRIEAPEQTKVVGSSTKVGATGPRLVVAHEVKALPQVTMEVEDVPLPDTVAAPERPPVRETDAGRPMQYVEGFVDEDGRYRVRPIR